MVEVGCALRFTVEALAEQLVVGKGRDKDLQCDLTAKVHFLSQVNHTHAPAPELPLDPVAWQRAEDVAPIGQLATCTSHLLRPPFPRRYSRTVQVLLALTQCHIAHAALLVGYLHARHMPNLAHDQRMCLVQTTLMETASHESLPTLPLFILPGTGFGRRTVAAGAG